MDYVTSIISAVIIFPIIAFLITVPFILYNYHRYGTVYYFRSFIIYSFVLYLLVAYFLVILPLPDINSINMNAETTQLIPLQFIYDFINKSGFIINDFSTYLEAIKTSYFYVPIFNIFLFIPFGIYLRYYFNCDLKKVIIFSFLLSLFFELTQLTGLYFIYPHSYRLFDVDDLMLNTLGGLTGYYVLGIFQKLLPTKSKIEEETNKRRVKITYLKRFTLFCLDLFILGILNYIFAIFLNVPIIFTASLYYIVIPILFKGRTLGSKFLHISLTSKEGKLKFYQILVRYCLFVLIFFIIPHFNLLNFISIMFNFVYFIIKKEMIYETISKTKLQSTFALKNNDNNCL